MPRCDLANNPKQCAEMYRRSGTRPGHICHACPTGRGRVATADPAMEKPAEIIPSTIPDHIPVPKKEDVVDQAKVKENILRVLARKGTMSQSSLKLFAANKTPKEEFLAALDGLAKEGKVVTKEGIREGSLSVALPGSPDPRPADAVKKVEPAKKSSATPPHQVPCQKGALDVRAA